MRIAPVLVVLLLALGAVAGWGGGSAPTPLEATGSHYVASTSGALTGNITGPSVVAVGANQRYVLQASGGPAVAPNGTIVGNLTYYASVSGSDLTGVQITPTSAAIVAGAPGRPLLQAGAVAQTLTLSVELVSVYLKQNATLNLTYTVQVVEPYVVAAEIVNPGNVTVAAFAVLVALDGVQVGNASVPSILAHADYNLSFRFAAANLAPGWHTFTLFLGQSHGLLRFANGTEQYAASFYVTGAAPSYTLWYVTGAVAFLGVLFIFGARLGARRRGAARK